MEEEIKKIKGDLITHQIQLSVLQSELREVQRLLRVVSDKYYLLAQFIK
jgi:hypothetical protein